MSFTTIPVPPLDFSDFVERCPELLAKLIRELPGIIHRSDSIRADKRRPLAPSPSGREGPLDY